MVCMTGGKAARCAPVRHPELGAARAPVERRPHVILSSERRAARWSGHDPRVILSAAKDLMLRILRSFGVFAPQDDEDSVIRSEAKDLSLHRAKAAHGGTLPVS